MAARWSIRVLLAVLLAFGSEVLLWMNPLTRPLEEWVLLAGGYLLLAVILLDLLARYNVRDLLGLMALAGVYGLCSGLLLNPALTLFDVPRTLVTRVTGAHTLLGLEMLFVFLALTGGQQRHLRRVITVGAFAVGLAWGVWARWAEVYTEMTTSALFIEEFLLVGALGMAGVLAAWGWARRQGRDVTPADVQLSPRGWALVATGVMSLLFVRLVQESVDLTALLLTLTLLVISVMLLWFRRTTRLTPLIHAHLPMTPLQWVWVGLSVAALFWAGVLGYSLPLIGDETFNQVGFVVGGFTLYGLAWLPAVSLTHGARAYSRQIQAGQE